VIDLKRPVLILVVLLMLSSAVMGLSLSAPSSVSANSAWSFSVELNPTDSFSHADVLIDDAGLLTVYSNGSISTDAHNGGFVLKAFVIDTSPSSTSGLVLHVSHMGLTSGNHTLIVRENTGEEMSSSVQAYSAADLSAIESRLDEAKLNKENIDFQIQGILADSRAFNEMIKTNEGSIANLEGQMSQLDGVRSSLDNLEASLQQQGSLSSETKSALDQLRNEFDSLSGFLQEKEIAELEGEEGGEILPISGFVGLGATIIGKVWVPILLLFGLAAIVLIVFYVKKVLANRAGSPYFEADKEEEVSFDEGIEPEEEKESGKKGKWASD